MYVIQISQDTHLLKPISHLKKPDTKPFRCIHHHHSVVDAPKVQNEDALFVHNCFHIYPDPNTRSKQTLAFVYLCGYLW